jgi:voltage-gated sodium channel
VNEFESKTMSGPQQIVGGEENRRSSWAEERISMRGHIRGGKSSVGRTKYRAVPIVNLSPFDTVKRVLERSVNYHYVKLKITLLGLYGGLTSIHYVVSLLVLVQYIFVILGMHFFSRNDPFHFGSIGVTFMSLYRTAILDDWGALLFINYYGCRNYQVDGPVQLYTNDPDEAGIGLLRYCDPNVGSGSNAGAFVAAFYFIFYILIAHCCILSLIIAIIEDAYTSSLEYTYDEDFDISEYAFFKKTQEEWEMGKTQDFILHRLNPMRALSNSEFQAQNWLKRSFRGLSLQQKDDSLAVAYEKIDFSNWKTIIRFGRESLHYTTETTAYAFSIFCVIALTGIVPGLATISNIRNNMTDFNAVFDPLVLVLFWIEIFIRVGAERNHLYIYFRDGWNVFDFCLVIVLTATFAQSTVYHSSKFIMIFRTLRILRVLRHVIVQPGLNTMIDAVVDSFSNITSIMGLTLIFLLIFGLIGNALFAANDEFRYGSIPRAMISLFQEATFDDWFGAVYTAMYGCHDWPSASMTYTCGTNNGEVQVATVFFFYFTLVLGGFVLLTMFVGIMAYALGRQNKLLDTEQATQRRVNTYAKLKSIPVDQLRCYRSLFDYIDYSRQGFIEDWKMILSMKSVNCQPRNHRKVWSLLTRKIDECRGLDFSLFVMYMWKLREARKTEKIRHSKRMTLGILKKYSKFQKAFPRSKYNIKSKISRMVIINRIVEADDFVEFGKTLSDAQANYVMQVDARSIVKLAEVRERRESAKKTFLQSFFVMTEIKKPKPILSRWKGLLSEKNKIVPLSKTDNKVEDFVNMASSELVGNIQAGSEGD